MQSVFTFSEYRIFYVLVFHRINASINIQLKSLGLNEPLFWEPKALTQSFFLYGGLSEAQAPKLDLLLRIKKRAEPISSGGEMCALISSPNAFYDIPLKFQKMLEFGTGMELHSCSVGA